MAKRTNWAAAAGIVGAVLFGGLVLAVVYWPGSWSLPIVSAVVGDRDQAKVLAAIREQSHVPRPAIDVAKWVPAQRVDLDPSRRICWIEYRIELGGAWGWQKASGYYDVTDSTAIKFSWGEWRVLPDAMLPDAQYETAMNQLEAKRVQWISEQKRAFPGLKFE